jgi:hypothetical protein
MDLEEFCELHDIETWMINEETGEYEVRNIDNNTIRLNEYAQLVFQEILQDEGILSEDLTLKPTKFYVPNGLQ